MEIQVINIAIGIIIGALITFLIIITIDKIMNKKKSNERVSLKTMKSYVKEAHNHMVESANNLIKLYEVFNEIEQSKNEQ